jgi:hypothetical protein
MMCEYISLYLQRLAENLAHSRDPSFAKINHTEFTVNGACELHVFYLDWTQGFNCEKGWNFWNLKHYLKTEFLLRLQEQYQNHYEMQIPGLQQMPKADGVW